jgi:hypothetical protein
MVSFYAMTKTGSFTPSPAVLVICLPWRRKGGATMAAVFYVVAIPVFFAGAALIAEIIDFFMW